MSNKKKYTIDISNIKYCTITIIYNESQDLFVQVERFFNWSEENRVTSKDTIILEHENIIIELESKSKSKSESESEYQIDKDITFNYYSYGVF